MAVQWIGFQVERTLIDQPAKDQSGTVTTKKNHRGAPKGRPRAGGSQARSQDEDPEMENRLQSCPSGLSGALI